MRYRKWILLILVCLSCLTASSLIQCAQHAEQYLSLDPNNHYTGMASCQSCHQRIYDSYIETGMGRSLYLPEKGKVIEQFGPEYIVYDSLQDFYYQAVWKGEEMQIREFRLDNGDTSYVREEKVDYVIGSGNQTRSYLLERNGYLYEHPITWYVLRQIWDLSPGYDVNNSRFGREIGVECLACHTGKIDYIASSKNRFHEIALGIDCEKCHGPGEAHIRLIENGQLIDVGEEIDYSIVNPSKLPIDKQFDVCQQCHLQGVNVMADGTSVLDFRPAMNLGETMDVFVEERGDSEAFGIASHAERLQASRCFIASQGNLTCTTCHDPHKSIHKTDPMVFSKQCQQCHQSGKEVLCAASESDQARMQGDCISCHMPQGGTSDIPHVSFHDHKIRIVQARDSASVTEIADYLQLRCVTDSSPSNEIQGVAWLVYFERQEANPSYLQKAHTLLEREKSYEAAKLAYYQGKLDEAFSVVQEVLATKPEHDLARFLEGEILESQQKYALAFGSFDALYQAQPENIEAGLKAAVNLLRSKQGDLQVLGEAQQRFERLLESKPFDHRILTNLGFVALNQRNAPQAERYLVQALSYEPDDRQALENMILLQAVKGNAILVERYLTHLRQKHPSYAGLARLEEIAGKLR